MKYRREIDGLRAVAVVPVILFHGGFTFFSGGFVGVDVFFVISGYLITTILLTELDAGRYSLLRFYERRARRILPALVVVMVAFIPFAWAWMLQTQIKDFFESLAVTSVFGSNFLFYSESGYFAAVAEEKPLLHTWSLAVEEQYYLLFPPLLALAMKGGRRAALWFILAVAIASLGYAAFGGLEPEAQFFLTHVRVWELLVGSLCAYVMLYHPPSGHAGWSALGLGFIIVAIFGFDSSTPYPYFAMLPVAGTALIILFATPDTWAARILSQKVFVGIGLISFSAYLWHQPLFAFARIKAVTFPPTWVMVLLAILSIALAALSWRYVEQPFRGNPPPLLPRRRSVFAAAILSIAVLAGIGTYGHLQDGFPDRPVVRNLAQPMIDARFERFRTWDVMDGIVPARFDLTRYSDDAETTKILVLGDSHSKGLFNAFYQNPDLFREIEVRRVGVDFKCFDEATSEDEAQTCFENLVAKTPALFEKADYALFAARWHRPGRLPVLSTAPQALRARGIVPLLVGNTSEYDTEAPVMIHEIARDIGFDGEMAFPQDRTNQVFYSERSALALDTNVQLKALARDLGMPFLDRYGLVCDDAQERCTGITPEGNAVSYDYGHWTLAGARYFGQVIAERNWLALP